MNTDDIQKLNHKITEAENKGINMPHCFAKRYEETKGSYCQLPCVYRDECKKQYEKNNQ